MVEMDSLVMSTSDSEDGCHIAVVVVIASSTRSIFLLQYL